jgi:hypothetical protein
VALGLTLLVSGQLEEHDGLVSGLAERFRAQGPPTALQWALTYLGISASVQGRHHEASLFYDDAAAVAVPDRTHTLKNPLEARAALRRGDRSRAYEILRSYIAELLDNDNIYIGKYACTEFITMMVKVDRLPEAARILGFLESTDSLDVSALKALVAGDAGTIASESARDTNHERRVGRDLDDRKALIFMRDVLSQLVERE